MRMRKEVMFPAPMQPQTKSELLARIDHSLTQIASVEYSNCEDVEKELLKEIQDSKEEVKE